MARTIQKKNNFNHGIVNREITERSDLPLLDKSAAELVNLVPSIYGGVRSRRGTMYVAKPTFEGETQAVGVATSTLGDASAIQSAGSNFISDAIGDTKTLFQIEYSGVFDVGHFTIHGLKLRYALPAATIYWQASGQNGVKIRSVSLTSSGVGFVGTVRVLAKGRTATTATLAMTQNAKGEVTNLTVSNAGDYLSNNTSATSALFSRTGEARQVPATLYVSADGTNWSAVSSIVITESATDFTFDIRETYQYIKLELETNDTIATDFTLNYVHLETSSGTIRQPDGVRLIPFIFNENEKYLIVVGGKRILIYKDDELQQMIVASEFTDEVVENLSYTAKDDTIVFTHPNIRPYRLLRMDNGWNLGAFPLSNIPSALFGTETIQDKTGNITPSATDGNIILTGSNFTSDMVGQYIDGGGGRVKITGFISATQLRARTIIPFYTTSAFNTWQYISGYEPAWSASRGWPRTCLFVQQRLAFGGSRDVPNTIWLSRVGDYGNFDNIGNYDNDAIEWPLLTNSAVVNMAEQQGLHVFTSMEEWVVAENTLTPDNFYPRKYNENGCWSKTPAIVYENAVLAVEKNGKNLYIHGLTDAGWQSRNMSLYFQYEGDPVSLAIEKNSVKDKGDFLYMVLDNGMMCVQALGLSENINAPCIFKTEGTILAAATLLDTTYLAVKRNDEIYIERIADVQTDCTQVIGCVNGVVSGLDMYANSRIYMKQGSKIRIKTVQVGGVIENLDFNDSTVEVGLPFKYKLKSNPITIGGHTSSTRKRINRATIETVDTQRIQLDDQILEGVETYEFYAVSAYEKDCRYEITGEYTPIKILSVQLDISYEG